MKGIFDNDRVDPFPTLNIPHIPADFRVIKLIEVIIETAVVTEKPVNLANGPKRGETSFKSHILNEPRFKTAPLPGNEMHASGPEFSLMHG
ncbi:hypothetical protein D3C80_338210 [compost metagenome]